MTHDSRLEAAALDWVIRQRDPDFSDWAAFTDWLGADPAHAEAYHEAAALDADLAALPPADEPTLPPAIEPAPLPEDAGNVVPFPRRVSRRTWLSGAVAASLVGMISYSVLRDTTPDSYRVETAMGETRVIALADGSRISVNGGTAMVLSHDDPRRATLERGQALFTVVHREDAPFRVKVGEAELVDIGTVFDVVRANGETRVAVSEGAVAYTAAAGNIRVDAGRRLVVREASHEADISRADPAAVGSWNSGQLIYDGAPLEQVAAEISRTTGLKVRTTSEAASISFRGALQTEMPAEKLVADLAALSGTRARRDAGGWTLVK
ncbi:MAG TPA: FecR domain-containing protein [Sphingobium sp.]